jgi:hypothetical protein
MLVPPVDLRASFYPVLDSKYATWGQNHFALLHPRTVEWKQNCGLDWRVVGHILLFFASESTKSNEDLLAVLRGYDWLHGRPRTVEIEVRPPDSAYDDEFLAAARADIEHVVLQGKLPGLRAWISPRVFVHANA